MTEPEGFDTTLDCAPLKPSLLLVLKILFLSAKQMFGQRTTKALKKGLLLPNSLKALNKSWLIIFVWEAVWWVVNQTLDLIEEPRHEITGGPIRTAAS
ncbi:hypothetical protein V6N13_002462 [Hibiscus sabdariffa]|uniref:Uncharacterized protein n=1 Tax=Hibiscus sabdariffa TaxID=183260 RepID=A0ABR2C2X5_9ROSI